MTTSSPTAFVEATRDSTSVLVAIERRCLRWLATRVPPAINSDHLTALALAAMAGAGACYWAARLNRQWLAGVVVCLAANWFGDSLDGTVARLRQHQRPRYGFYVDHVVDCFGVAFLLGGLGLSGFMSPLVSMTLLAAYFMLSIEIYLATYCLRVFKLSFAGVGPTELRVLIAIGSLALIGDPHVDVLGRTFKLFDVGGVVAIAGILVVLSCSVASNVRALYREEPIPAVPSIPPVPRSKLAAGRVPAGRRWLIFNAVGAMGFGVQLLLVWVLTSRAGINYLAATILAAEAAIIHNFVWHSSWTWSDRAAGVRQTMRRLARFNLTTGLVSIAGNLAVTSVLVRLFGVHYLAANVIAIAACSGANFILSHRVVFAPALVVVAMLSAGGGAHAAELSPDAAAAFDRNVRLVEARLDDERARKAPFLWIDRLPEAARRETGARLARAEVVVEKLPASPGSSWPGALFHHWMATSLVGGASLDRVVQLMQDYDRYSEVYRPTVRRSTLIAHDGDTFTAALQLFTKKVISVVLNTEQRVAYLSVSPTRMQVRSMSTRIAEVRDPGKAGEREVPIGLDSGFLWRFNNYCALEQQPVGTFVQCETLSLTRDTPTGLGWLIGPFVTSIPRESLEFTLTAMRTSLQGGRR
ncbi:MAG: GtrA family protein [Acidobacteriota bacterium]